MSNEKEALVAPQEIRDLLARLTEYRVESIPIDEPRTLAGLSAHTGIPVSRLEAALLQVRGERTRPDRRPLIGLALAGALVFAVGVTQSRSQPTPQVASGPALVTAPEPTASDLSNLVPLTSVTYGPDSGTYQVDPTFEPSSPPPPGIGFYASIDNILWGAGDRLKVARREPLTDSEAATLRSNLSELLVKVREDATRRKLTLSVSGADPALSFDGKGFVTQLRIDSYNGSEGVSLRLPPVGVQEKDADRVIKRAVDKAVRNLQASLTWQNKVSGHSGPT